LFARSDRRSVPAIAKMRTLLALNNLLSLFAISGVLDLFASSVPCGFTIAPKER
jgi:hypothetical protein